MYLAYLSRFHIVSRMGLVRPGLFLAKWMTELRLVKTATRVDFPNFPLSITNPQAKQLAALMKDHYDPIIGVDEIAETLKGNSNYMSKCYPDMVYNLVFIIFV